MKSLFKGVLILLIGMISLSGFSSTTTSTLKKRDLVEQVAVIQKDYIQAIQSESVEIKRDTSESISNIFNEEIAGTLRTNLHTVTVASNPPPLVQLE